MGTKPGEKVVIVIDTRTSPSIAEGLARAAHALAGAGRHDRGADRDRAYHDRYGPAGAAHDLGRREGRGRALRGRRGSPGAGGPYRGRQERAQNRRARHRHQSDVAADRRHHRGQEEAGDGAYGAGGFRRRLWRQGDQRRASRRADHGCQDRDRRRSDRREGQDPGVSKSQDIVARLRKLEGGGLRTFAEDPPLVWEKADGCHVWDADGKRYLDLYGGFAVAAIGYGHPKVVAAIQAQAATLMHCPSAHPSGIRAEFYQALASIAPAGLERFLPAVTSALAHALAIL